MLRAVSSAFLTLLFAASMADAARLIIRLCNNTSNRVGIAVGYSRNRAGRRKESWNVAAQSPKPFCAAPSSRLFLVYAVDYDRGGEWSGQAFMFHREKEFTIRGTEDCRARGYDRTGFFEVDTGDQPSWTVQLTESADQAPDAGAAIARSYAADAAAAGKTGDAASGSPKPKLMCGTPDEDCRYSRSRLLKPRNVMSGNFFILVADVLRVNISHTHDRMRELVSLEFGRLKTQGRGRPIGILVDLQGTKAPRRQLHQQRRELNWWKRHVRRRSRRRATPRGCNCPRRKSSR